MIFMKLSAGLGKILSSLLKMTLSLEENVPVSRKMYRLNVFEVYRSFQRSQRCPKITPMFC
ncbi:hypothetical protein BYT27DRAFT_7305435 [Phlegmacium glaucopus]|nr:hypothetical protein BYT27DRAFT_7305435 [Phlegmacium glaucopus]